MIQGKTRSVLLDLRNWGPHSGSGSDLWWLRYKGVGSVSYKIGYSQSSLFVDSIFVNSPTHSNLFVTPKSILIALLWLFGTWAGGKKSSDLMCIFPAEVTRSQSAFLFNFSYYKQVSFPQSVYYNVFHIFVLFGGDFTVLDSLQAKCWSAT